MSKVKKILAVLATMLIGTVAAVVIATPAQASVGNCATQQLCLYENDSWGGAWTYTTWESTSGACVTLPGSFRNQASSVRNAAYTHSVTLYMSANCGGNTLNVNPGGQFWFGTWSSQHWANDDIESYRWNQ